MIESLFNPEEIRAESSKRFEAFLAGCIFTFAAVLFAIGIIPPKHGAAGLGFLIISFICIPAAPFFVQLFKVEEKEELRKQEDRIFTKNLFTHHLDVIEIFAFFFLAVLFATSFVYVVAPGETSSDMFRSQVDDLEARGIVTGEAAGPVTQVPSFTEILVNNTVVLGLAFLFSFIFGAGAVFLVSWNASIIGVLVGRIAENPELLGLGDTGNLFTNYLVALPTTILRLLPHGIFEFGAYFAGAVAGGVLSAGVIQESIKCRRTKFRHLKQVIIDSSIYFGIAILLLIIGALVEVGV